MVGFFPLVLCRCLRIWDYVCENADFLPLNVHIIFINIYYRAFFCNVINSEELIGTTEYRTL